jgi:hypothetical protein
MFKNDEKLVEAICKGITAIQSAKPRYKLEFTDLQNIF